MKKNLLIILSLLIYPFLNYAQSVPDGFNYQAVVRDAAGNIKKDATVELKFTLLPTQFSSKPSWVETHSVKTDAFGTCSLVIGAGRRISGSASSFSKVDFSASNYWIKVELKDNGQYIELGGAQKLLSVPYARVAGKVAADAPSMPVGSIMPFAGSIDKIPDGWLLCDGSEVSRSSYFALFNIIGTIWGVGNNATTFHLPDFRGMFLRGVNGGSGNDPNATTRANQKGGNIGDNVGTYQEDEIKAHNHSTSKYSVLATRSAGGSSVELWYGDQATSTSTVGGSETRPKNANVYYIIKH